MLKGFRSFFILFILLLAVNTAASAYATSYGPTKAHEGLYRVALHLQPSSGVTVEQTMIALFQANPDAFINNNINGLKTGLTLSIPTLAQIEAIPAATAFAEVQRQNERWRKLMSTAGAAKHVKNKHQLAKKAPTATNNANAAYDSFASTIVTALDQLKQQVSEMVTKEQLGSVQNELSHEITTATAFRQDVTQQLSAVQQQNQQLSQQLSQVNAQLTTLTGQIKQIEVQQQQQDQSITQRIEKALAAYMADWQQRNGIYLLAGLLGLFLLWLLYKLLKRNKARKLNQITIENDTDDDTKDEYDFMNSDEGIPAKLDLARAYIDMEDFASAEVELKEIIKKGNVLQKQEAERLLKKIK